jgi:hypothetical protein
MLFLHFVPCDTNFLFQTRDFFKGEDFKHIQKTYGIQNIKVITKYNT